MNARLPVREVTFAHPGHTVLDSVSFSIGGSAFVALQSIWPMRRTF